MAGKTREELEVELAQQKEILAHKELTEDILDAVQEKYSLKWVEKMMIWILGILAGLLVTGLAAYYLIDPILSFFGAKQ